VLPQPQHSLDAALSEIEIELVFFLPQPIQKCAIITVVIDRLEWG